MQLTTLNWTIVDSEGSRFSRGKNDFYAIIIRGVPEGRPKNCAVELYVTDKPMTAFEIKVVADSGQIEPISRTIVWGDLPRVTKINQTVESMKETAGRRENEMLSLDFWRLLDVIYNSKYKK
jgi:hypothetical protein